MRLVVIAGAIATLVSFLGTPLLINFLKKHGYSQAIRVSSDGEQYPAHEGKRGTPSMGGVAILVAVLVGYFLTHLITWRPISISALLVLYLMVGLGLVGMADDYLKIFKQRSTGLRARTKLIGQAIVAFSFAYLSVQFPDSSGNTPASMAISFVRAPSIVLPLGLFLIWQYGQNCAFELTEFCYNTQNPLDLAMVAAATAGASFGFLWFNTAPARIFMGDTGSLALGGGIAGLAILTRTELLLPLIAGLFLITTLSVIAQVGSFKLTGKRIFRMAPLHHHFEMLGWPEIQIVVRFWIIQGLFIGAGLTIFYAEWVRA